MWAGNTGTCECVAKLRGGVGDDGKAGRKGEIELDTTKKSERLSVREKFELASQNFFEDTQDTTVGPAKWPACSYSCILQRSRAAFDLGYQVTCGGAAALPCKPQFRRHYGR